jgi:uncharacterized membrane protein
MADTTEQLKDTVSTNGGSSLSKEKVLPALATAAAAAAAGLAATKGPDLLKKLTGEADEQAEELGGKAAEGAKQQLGSSGGLAGKAASKLMGGGSQKGGKTRRLPIQRWTDVAVPIDKAYDAWTNFEEFPNFMHRVLEVSQEDANKIHWREKIWFSTREWDGEITDKRKNDRIAWKSVSGTQHSGVITFHKLDDKLTRVMVDIDFLPTGMIEKMASGMRFVKRAVEADLARFKAYVEFGDAKELEYKATPAEMEQNRDDEDQDGGDSQETENRGGDDDRESDREERESRREERRKAMASGGS